MKEFLLVCSCLFYSVAALAQEQSPIVENTFRGDWCINQQTTVMLPKKSLEFSIKHRFGSVGFNKTFYKQFIGLDLPANIRFGFAYPLFKNCNIGVGRTKNGKTVDGEIKILIASQRENNKWPVSVALYSNTSISTDDFLQVRQYEYFSDSSTAFQNKFEHRLNYFNQVIISRKFGNRFSLQVSPSYLHHNLVAVNNENDAFVLPVAAFIKTGIYSSVLMEYYFRTNNKPEKNLFPVSIAYELASAGHVFQIIVSSTSEINEQLINSKAQNDYLNNNFVVGFNLKRTFWFKSKS